MKTFGKKLSFSFNAVNAGQRAVKDEPQLVVGSTPGSFRITKIVSRVLGIAHGEYVMFINNIVSIDQAIAEKVPEIVAFCEENGLDITADEARKAIYAEFGMWAIAKGIQEFDSKGNPRTSKERLTKADRLKFVESQFDAMLTAAKTSEDAEVVAAVTREGITEDELKDFLCQFVEGNEVPKFKGSKTANPAALSGAGVSLTFTDSAIWSELKADMGENAFKLNRVYNLDVEDVQKIEINNGFENVEVPILILGDYTDEKPIRISKKNADGTTTETEVEE